MASAPGRAWLRRLIVEFVFRQGTLLFVQRHAEITRTLHISLNSYIDSQTPRYREEIIEWPRSLQKDG